jgi:hypothetical protein
LHLEFVVNFNADEALHGSAELDVNRKALLAVDKLDCSPATVARGRICGPEDTDGHVLHLREESGVFAGFKLYHNVAEKL